MFCRYHPKTRLVTDVNEIKHCPKCRGTKEELTTVSAVKIINELEENARETISSLNGR